MPYCFLCYSADNILYTKNPFICKKCIICDICGLTCNDKCVALFAKCLTIADSLDMSNTPS